MEEKNNKSRFITDFPYLGILGIITAFIGWFVENLSKFIARRFIDSRFHLLPFISPYGLAVFAVYLLIGDSNDISFFGRKLFKEKTKKSVIYSNVIAFFLICFVVFIGELVVGNLWEILFGVELWNYDNHFLHVTSYTSVLTTFGFGGGAYLLQKFIMYPALEFFKKHVSYKKASFFSIVVGSIIVLDTIIMMMNIILFGEAKMYWEIQF